MYLLKKFVQWTKAPNRFFKGVLLKFGFVLPDKFYLRCLVRVSCGYWPNLKNPKSFNEKLNWLKLYYRRPEYTMMVDKYAVKEYVAGVIGKEYVIPTIGIWNSTKEIDWDSLPERFVLKTTHGGGNEGVVICRDKKSFDCQEAVEKLESSLKTDIYVDLREWPYKNVPHRIIAEEFLDSGEDDLPDYKFFCFDGIVKALFIGSERQSGDVKFDFFDADFNHLDIVQFHPMSGKTFSVPKNFEEMKRVAEKLSQGIPHVRVDLYNVNGKVYFGELTFYHHGGMVPFHPQEWDYTFGSWLILPQKYIY